MCSREKYEIPTKLRYGLRFLTNLASRYPTGEVVSISTVSKEESISNKYLEQIISAFVKAGLIKGSRGKGGGYHLIRDPKTVSVYEVAEALGENFTFIGCVAKSNYCGRQSACALNELCRIFQTRRKKSSKKGLSKVSSGIKLKSLRLID